MSSLNITLTKQTKTLKEVTFKWNTGLTRYKVKKTNISDNDLKLIIIQNGHEGDPVNGWKTSIN